MVHSTGGQAQCRRPMYLPSQEPLDWVVGTGEALGLQGGPGGVPFLFTLIKSTVLNVTIRLEPNMRRCIFARVEHLKHMQM